MFQLLAWKGVISTSLSLFSDLFCFPFFFIGWILQQGRSFVVLLWSAWGKSCSYFVYFSLAPFCFVREAETWSTREKIDLSFFFFFFVVVEQREWRRDTISDLLSSPDQIKCQISVVGMNRRWEFLLWQASSLTLHGINSRKSLPSVLLHSLSA
jgi:hypothetical protein